MLKSLLKRLSINTEHFQVKNYWNPIFKTKKNKFKTMGKKDKEHRKKVQARNQRLKRDESTLINLFKKMEMEKNIEKLKGIEESNQNENN